MALAGRAGPLQLSSILVAEGLDHQVDEDVAGCAVLEHTETPCDLAGGLAGGFCFDGGGVAFLGVGPGGLAPACAGGLLLVLSAATLGVGPVFLVLVCVDAGWGSAGGSSWPMGRVMA